MAHKKSKEKFATGKYNCYWFNGEYWTKCDKPEWYKGDSDYKLIKKDDVEIIMNNIKHEKEA
ncbi:hypothetical protein [Poseidonibacter ostreae]|uniref:Uncharacterized protein n=1 Tax=Poseidonibacter ostreae TaxID=2654171 RepID=A0A6L4WX45_9BACT|nr:hypothetical protein [Poseidonibacter ostreae]KAB7891429.1 hypothetical protein GBG19_00910 [Poseidonibacter ostreae]